MQLNRGGVDPGFNWNRHIAKREEATGFQLDAEFRILKALFCDKSGLRKERKAVRKGSKP